MCYVTFTVERNYVFEKFSEVGMQGNAWLLRNGSVYPHRKEVRLKRTMMKGKGVGWTTGSEPRFLSKEDCGRAGV